MPKNVVWREGLFGPEIGGWVNTPDISIIEAICRRILCTGESTLEVTFFADGGLNKLYNVTVQGSPTSYIFRVALDLEPFFKTASTVATLDYLHLYTSLPVPRVVAHCSTEANELGFEWILMEKVPGVPLRQCWSKMSDVALTNVVVSISKYISNLREFCNFEEIGSLYHFEELRKEYEGNYVETGSDDFVIGPIMNTHFFSSPLRSRLKRNLGPYENDKDYMVALMEVQLEEYLLLQKWSDEKNFDEGYDEESLVSVKYALRVLRTLQDILPKIFNPSLHINDEAAYEDSHLPDRPAEEDSSLTLPLLSRREDQDIDTPEAGQHDNLSPSVSGMSAFSLLHTDLSDNNIIVDPETFQITGLIDWECAYTAPAWEDHYPNFLRGPDDGVEEEPDDHDSDDWNEWRRKQLRRIFDLCTEQDGREADELKCDFRHMMDLADWSPNQIMRWSFKFISNEECYLKNRKGLNVDSALGDFPDEFWPWWLKKWPSALSSIAASSSSKSSSAASSRSSSPTGD